MRSMVLSIATAALLMTIVGACGNDAPTKAETTAIGNKTLTQYGGFNGTAAGQHCVGSDLVERLGGDGAEAVARKSDITKLDAKQRAAVEVAFNHCASANGTIGLSAQALGVTSATDPIIVCLTKGLRGKVGTMYVGVTDPTANHLLVDTFDSCVPAPVLAKALANDVATDPPAGTSTVDVAAVTACLTPVVQGKVGETFRRIMTAKTPVSNALKDVIGRCVPTD